MPTPALLLLVGCLIPVGSFLVLLFWGKRLGNPLSGYLGSVSSGATFVLSVAALITWLGGGTHELADWGAGVAPWMGTIGWIPVGQGIAQAHTGFIDLGIYVDSLTVAIFSMVSLVATLVHIFSIGYMREDDRFHRFFAFLSLFLFSMLSLVVSATILQLFICWELVGLCSYLLIGFWYEKKAASSAAIKAFVVNRIGDMGFLVGFGVLFYHMGNVTLPDLWALLHPATTGAAVNLPDGGVFSSALLTLVGIGLFCGAIGKSAQFPLHVWLPDAMEGPTPVSALIHAATMVAAGVFLVGRIFPILTPDARLFIAVIGCITLAMAALIAIAQTDIKKVLAYSTISQLGYMILAMGVGSWIGGLFHLITHAFFKALLFLGAGSVIHATHHEQDLRRYGGLLRKLPVTGACFGIAVLAIAGAPLLSGFYSKDTIIAHAGAFAELASHHGGSAYWLLFWIPVVIAYVTAFYMGRCWVLTFLGKPRDHHVHDHAHETTLLWAPLVVLAGLSILGGYIGVQNLLRWTIDETNAYSRRIDPGFQGFAGAWQGHIPGELSTDQHAAEGPAVGPEDAPLRPQIEKSGSTPDDAIAHAEHRGHELAVWVLPAFVVGLGLALLMYWGGLGLSESMLQRVPPLRWLHAWLTRAMGFDDLYRSVFVAGVMGAATLARTIDRLVIDPLVHLAAWLTRSASTAAGAHDRFVVDGAVNGVGRVAGELSDVVRLPQTGRIRGYVTGLLVAAALVSIVTVLLRML